MREIIFINGYNLDIETVYKALNFNKYEVKLDDKARKFCKKTRNQVDEWLRDDPPIIYGINTGLGNMKDTVLSPKEHIRWNKTIPYPHAVAFGKNIDFNVTRTALLIRANVLARGYSAVRPELIDRLLEIYNSGIAPVIHELGSTGLSDLAHLAELAIFVSGSEEAEAVYNGEIVKAKAAYRSKGIQEIFEFECKEVLSIMNGSTMTQANAVLCFVELEKLFNRLKGRMEKMNKPLFTSIYNTMSFINKNLNQENNVSCDNPLLFSVGEDSFEHVMGCNCSNTQIGYVMDLIPLITLDIAKFIYQTNPINVKNEKIACLINQIDQLSIPSTADSISTKAGQEDHVEFSYGASRKATKATKLLNKIYYYIN